MIGPLSQLRIVGSVCPCVLSTDESLAKSSDAVLSNLFTNIQWHQKSKHFKENQEEDDEKEENEADLEQNKKTSSFGGFMSKITSKVSAVASSTVSRNRTIVVNGTCKFVDAGGLLGVGSGKGVVLEITGQNLHQLPLESRQYAKKKLCLPLRKIGSVCPYAPSGVKSVTSTTPTDNIVSIRAVPDDYDSSHPDGEELARIEITSLDSSENEVMGTTREDVIESFKHILEWDRARRVKNNEENEEEIQTKGGLRGRAQKAAHFAKREIELQTKRREREQRKAKYIKDAGGLKYTALAMANRQE